MGAIVGLILFGIPSAVIAFAKGLKPLRWLMGLGVIGLVVVICLPSANQKDISDEEIERRQVMGNRTGAIMFGITIGISVILTLVVFAMSS
jgi:hypothetical protein